MSKIIKIGLILTGAGVLLCLLSYILVGGKWTGYNSKGNDYVSKSYESGTGITEIKIDESANEVIFKTADTDKITIDYYDDPEKPMYEITEDAGKLTFSHSGNGSFKLVNIDLAERSTTVTVPADYDGLLDLELSSGSITADDITAGQIKIDNSAGSIVLNNIISAGNVDIENTSGSTEFTNLKAGGDITFDNTAGSIGGSIDGSQSDYTITTDVTAGSCNLPATTGGSKNLSAKVTAGSIEITFTR